MEVKKSPEADLQNKKVLFLEIGLVVSLVLCILMFSFSQREKTVKDMGDAGAVVEEQMIEITRQEEKQPEVQKKTIAVATDIINIVKNDTKVTTDLNFEEFTEDAIVVEHVAVKEEQVVAEDTPFTRAEVMPTFQGGDLNTFRKWVADRLNYPTLAAENGIYGTVATEFVVEKDGSVSNVKVLATPDKSLGEEAIRVISSSPKWTPGKQRGMPVRLRYSLPVVFKLQ